jgi:hypothetical protein
MNTFEATYVVQYAHLWMPQGSITVASERL